jgi:hypothetical protein
MEEQRLSDLVAERPISGFIAEQRFSNLEEARRFSDLVPDRHFSGFIAEQRFSGLVEERRFSAASRTQDSDGL